jgi:diguanylate cyclase (GGDEF)-like protein
VLFLDLDQFKDVNDTWGHTTGDRLLVEVGRRLTPVLRPGDLLARLGGDEFVTVVTSVSGPAAAMTLAARLAAALAEPFDLGVCQVHISASIGVVHLAAGEAGTAEDMLRDADTAMYRAKDVGGDALCLFDATMRADVDRRVALEADLRHVVELDQLRLHYQPVVDLASGALIGFEALVRWERPGHGLVPPLTFISAAEDTGAIVAIGGWVLDEGCRQLAAWDADLGLDGDLSLAFNLSARQLRDSSFVDAVAAALASSGIAPGRLVVEITESVVLEEVAEVQDALVALRALGVHLAADDFGTGYSSLSYLKRHPIDHVKIDRSFVTGLGTDPDDEGIVTAILAMAKALRLTVVAEGIETETQRRRLTELGCDHAQGYLFAAPLPTAAAAALIERSVRSGWVPWDADPGDPLGLRELTGDLGAAARGPQGR